jgi:hypothetical protein
MRRPGPRAPPDTGAGARAGNGLTQDAGHRIRGYIGGIDQARRVGEIEEVHAFYLDPPGFGSDQRPDTGLEDTTAVSSPRLVVDPL